MICLLPCGGEPEAVKIVNDSDMLGPFGGHKYSGPGRAFGPEGYGEYLEHKMIHLPAGWEA